MRGQVVPDAVEFLDFHVQLTQRCDEIETSVCNGAYTPKATLRLKAEKSQGLCRQLVLPSPEDALVLQALSNALWKEIKDKSPSKNSFYAPQDQPFQIKNRELEQDEWGYGPVEAWLDFQKSILKFSQEYNFVVVTDVANYYDFIIHGYLRSILSDYGIEREYALDLLLYVLDSMLWRPDYMPNYGIGLPQMNLDAPRLLAHTHLFEIDEIFASREDVSFARYMDDMDFGVDTIAVAKEVLRDLDLALQTRNLRLNSGKTKILTATEALYHFRIIDNELVSIIIERVRKLYYLEYYSRIYCRLAVRAIDTGLRTGRFNGGNGDKILKRLLGLCLWLECGISDYAFREILYGKPGLREILLKCWAKSHSVSRQLKIVSGFLLSGQAVDDLSRIQIATSLAGAQLERKLLTTELDLLMSSFLSKSPFDTFCCLWLTSRFMSRRKLKDAIRRTRHIWARHRFLIRTVSGFYGIFCGSKYLTGFERYVRKWGGPDAISILDFHEGLVKISVMPVLAFLKAPNTSVMVGISHSKAMILMSALGSAVMNKAAKTKLLGVHGAVMADLYYQNTFSRIISNAP